MPIPPMLRLQEERPLTLGRRRTPLLHQQQQLQLLLEFESEDKESAGREGGSLTEYSLWRMRRDLVLRSVEGCCLLLGCRAVGQLPLRANKSWIQKQDTSCWVQRFISNFCCIPIYCQCGLTF